jgi:hypothetical protein
MTISGKMNTDNVQRNFRRKTDLFAMRTGGGIPARGFWVLHVNEDVLSASWVTPVVAAKAADILWSSAGKVGSWIAESKKYRGKSALQAKLGL